MKDEIYDALSCANAINESAGIFSQREAIKEYALVGNSMVLSAEAKLERSVLICGGRESIMRTLLERHLDFAYKGFVRVTEICADPRYEWVSIHGESAAHHLRTMSALLAKVEVHPLPPRGRPG